jgi:hypothetical protein
MKIYSFKTIPYIVDKFSIVRLHQVNISLISASMMALDAPGQGRHNCLPSLPAGALYADDIAGFRQ